MEKFNLKEVNLTGGYLFSKQELNRKITINAVYDRFYETKRIEAMDCVKDSDRDSQPQFFWDSDVAKWIEGASYIIAKNPDKELENKIEEIIDKIEKNMWEDGYFNSYYTVMEPDKRFTNINNHELYCAGHLIEAAIAYFNATGKDRFLNLMCRYADLIYKIFYVEDSASFQVPGHEEIELALYKLYKQTGNEKYLELCRYFIEARGKSKKGGNVYRHRFGIQDHIDIYNQHTAEGHSVRACYFYAGAADLAYETENEKMKEILKELFSDIKDKKMYVTGGIGSVRNYEGFAGAYNLPNENAYSETCAGISLMYFADRMLKIAENTEFADVIERVFYNNVLSGISLGGDAFFYENPLEINIANHKISEKYGLDIKFPITERVKVFGCSCCPPNLNRLLASIEEYIYYYSDETIFINQFAQSEMKKDDVFVSMKTEYPLNGRIEIKAKNVKRLAVRIPSWCEKFNISSDYTVKNGYAFLENPTDVEVDFEMKPKWVYSNAEVKENVGKCCVSLGPVIYCAEALDNGEILDKIFMDTKKEAKVCYNENYGLNELSVSALKLKTEEELYSYNKPEFLPVTLRMIPYSCFANRGETSMKVWFMYKD